jgi:mRNA-degrading endonuclease RelE of RelBE toxin-antitoxin system
MADTLLESILRAIIFGLEPKNKSGNYKSRIGDFYLIFSIYHENIAI